MFEKGATRDSQDLAALDYFFPAPHDRGMHFGGINFDGAIVPRGQESWSFLGFSDSYIVLEGLNGAGKSTLMRGIESVVEKEIKYKGSQSPYVRPSLLLSLNWDEFADGKKSLDPLISKLWDRFVERNDENQISASIAREEVAKIWKPLIEESLEDKRGRLKAVIEKVTNRELPYDISYEDMLHTRKDDLSSYADVLSSDEIFENLLDFFCDRFEVAIFPSIDEIGDHWNVALIKRSLLPLNSNLQTFYDFLNWPDESAPKNSREGLLDFRYNGISTFHFGDSCWFIAGSSWWRKYRQLPLTSINPDVLSVDENIEELTQELLSFGIQIAKSAMNSQAETLERESQYANFIYQEYEEFSNLRLLNDMGNIDTSLKLLAKRISENATHMSRRFIENIPELWLEVNEPHEWPAKGVAKWKVRSKMGELSSIKELSETQQRWVKIAIWLSCVSPQSKNFIFIDEPEKGLHLSSANMVHETLQVLSANNILIVASHSPIFLRAPQVILVEESLSGFREFQSIIGPIESDLRSLGLSMAEYASICKLLLIVEGEYDKNILEALLPEFLNKNRIHIVSGDGLYGMPSFFESSIIPYLIGIKTVFLVDGVNNQALQTDLHRLRSFPNLTYQQFKLEIESTSNNWIYSGNPKSNRKLFELIAKVFAHQRDLEIEIIGTPVHDCLEWLPIKEFGIGVSEWKKARNDYFKLANGQPTGVGFKSYISARMKKTQTKHELSPRRAREIAERLHLRGEIPSMVKDVETILRQILTSEKKMSKPSIGR